MIWSADYDRITSNENPFSVAWVNTDDIHNAEVEGEDYLMSASSLFIDGVCS